MKKTKAPPEDICSGNIMVSPKRLRKYAKALQKLEKELGHKLTSREVVEAAKPKSSPLHDFFDWDVERAAQKHWLWQARQLIAVVEVRVLDYMGRQTSTRRWVNVRLNEGESGERVYLSHKVVRTNLSLRKQVLHEAVRELETWFSRYRTYGELRKTLLFIEKIIPIMKEAFFGKKPKEAAQA